MCISVFLDTNVFIGESYDFKSSSNLGILKSHIDKGSAILYINEIVVQEVEKHITMDIKGTVSRIKKTHKQPIYETTRKVGQGLIIFEDMEEYDYLLKAIKEPLPLEQMVDDGKNKFKVYLEDTKAYVIKNSDVNIDEILADYFSLKPPFEESQDKKSEFPDAIMIAKIKKIALISGKVVVVSNDKGMIRALSMVHNITCLEHIGKLLEKLSEEDLVKTVYNLFEIPSQNSKIKDIIKEKIMDSDILVDGYVYDRKGIIDGHEYEESFIDDVSDIGFSVDSVDNTDTKESKATVTLTCSAKIGISSTYLDENSSAWDSESKEYIYANYREIHEVHEVTFNCVMQINIDFTNTNITPSDADITLSDLDIELNQYTKISRICSPGLYEYSSLEEAQMAEYMD